MVLQAQDPKKFPQAVKVPHQEEGGPFGSGLRVAKPEAFYESSERSLGLVTGRPTHRLESSGARVLGVYPKVTGQFRCRDSGGFFY